MQNETTICLHRSAMHDELAADLERSGRKPQLFENIIEAHLERPVDHEPERALGIVLADESHRLYEIGIRERRHRDQQVVRQITRYARHGAKYRD